MASRKGRAPETGPNFAPEEPDNPAYMRSYMRGRNQVNARRGRPPEPMPEGVADAPAMPHMQRRRRART